MAAEEDKIVLLMAKLELLLKKQQDFTIEVNEIRKDIQILRNTQAVKLTSETSDKPVEEIVPPSMKTEEILKSKPVKKVQPQIPYSQKKTIKRTIKAPKEKSNLEKFIGENLINKIGILITIIGVIIGAKYSIENNLISPLTRIILGYLTGIGLLGFGIKLKFKYLNYSAVLVSGALAILYFITFAAYDFYNLFTQLPTFAFMLLFTVFGVITALHYNKQIIAHIGLVGAYGIPFMLSNDSGNTLVLFSYIAIINTGLLVISFRKHWKPLYYVAFAFTWLIYGGWGVFSAEPKADFTLAISFLSIFFFSFYIIFIAFKLMKSEKFKVSDIIILLLNAFIFYGLGIYFIGEQNRGNEYLGLFTLTNAIIHFCVAFIIYKRKLADNNLFYLIAGLVLTFITIAVPVQLDGNWVTLIWVFEAALLFWIGRTKKVYFYENLSYVLLVLALLSLSMDWGDSYSIQTITSQNHLEPFLNRMLLTSLLCVFTFGFMTWIQQKFKIEKKTSLSKIMSIALPAVFTLTFYYSFFLEIEYFFNCKFELTKIDVSGIEDYAYTSYNYTLLDFGVLWNLVYTMFFVTILSFITQIKIKNRVLGVVSLSVGLLTVLAFLTSGLYTLSELRESYLTQEYAEYFEIGTNTIYMRYVAFLFFAFLLFAIYKLVRQEFMRINFRIPFEIVLHISIIWVASSELLNWMDLAGSNQSYKLGLSILWGIYALILIILGIWKGKKYLRICAISLFSLTLIKLFFYDITSLNTISKTIVFVSLGILLLIISFLYNKYNHKISHENET